MFIDSLLGKNMLTEVSLLQKLQDNKEINLSEKQKTIFKEILSEEIFDNKNIEKLSDAQKQELLRDLKLSNITGNDYFNLFLKKIDKNDDLSTIQKKILNNLNISSEDLGSKFLANSAVVKNKGNSQLKVEDDGMMKAKANSAYTQQIAMNLSVNFQAMTSRIEQIKSSFFV